MPRLTLSEIVREGLAGNDGSSVKLTRNARGEVQIEVRVGANEPGVDTVEQASGKAQAIFDALDAKYSSGGEAVPEPKPAPVKKLRRA